MTDRTPTPQQQAIFDAVLTGSQHIIVEASAGSGKTTTLVWLAKMLPPQKLNVFLAFNTNIAAELKERLPYFCQARTFHSYCYAALRFNLQVFPKVDVDKVRKIFLTVCDGDKEEFFLYLPFVKKLVSLAKGQASTSPDLYRLVDRHEIDCEGDEDIGIDYAQQVFDKSKTDHATIDLDDQLYLAWLLDIQFQRVDYLMVDEAQDLNTIQHALLPRMIKSNGRIVAVGDPYQSIYAFRGADSDSMNKLAAMFDMEKLPLSVSYRCSKSVVRAARNVINSQP